MSGTAILQRIRACLTPTCLTLAALIAATLSTILCITRPVVVAVICPSDAQDFSSCNVIGGSVFAHPVAYALAQIFGAALLALGVLLALRARSRPHVSAMWIAIGVIAWTAVASPIYGFWPSRPTAYFIAPALALAALTSLVVQSRDSGGRGLRGLDAGRLSLLLFASTLIATAIVVAVVTAGVDAPPAALVAIVGLLLLLVCSRHLMRGRVRLALAVATIVVPVASLALYILFVPSAHAELGWTGVVVYTPPSGKVQITLQPGGIGFRGESTSFNGGSGTPNTAQTESPHRFDLAPGAYDIQVTGGTGGSGCTTDFFVKVDSGFHQTLDAEDC